MQEGLRLSVSPDRFSQQMAESCADACFEFQADCNLLHVNDSKHMISFYLAFEVSGF